jgi:hypothetical protein
MVTYPGLDHPESEGALHQTEETPEAVGDVVSRYGAAVKQYLPGGTP